MKEGGVKRKRNGKKRKGRKEKNLLKYIELVNKKQKQEHTIINYIAIF